MVGRRSTSSVIPVPGTPLVRSQQQNRTAQTPGRGKVRSCVLDGILVTTEADYTTGFKSLYLASDKQVSAHIEVSLIDGTATIVRYCVRPDEHSLTGFALSAR